MSGGSPNPEVPPTSFSFRLACYEQFHWSPDTVANLTIMEAERLAVYFEETGAYHHKLRREQERSSGSTPQSDKVQVLETGFDDEEEEEDYGDS